MSALLVATITTEPDPRRSYRTRWAVSIAYPGHEDDPFLTLRTGNADEAAAAPADLAAFLGYTADEVEVHDVAGQTS